MTVEVTMKSGERHTLWNVVHMVIHDAGLIGSKGEFTAWHSDRPITVIEGVVDKLKVK